MAELPRGGKRGGATEGKVINDPFAQNKQHLSGFAVVEVTPGEEALQLAAKIAVACHSNQEVRELVLDPSV